MKHIRELDGIRGIAALMVFFHHAGFANLPDKDWHGPLASLVHLSAYGSTGVDLFFVLSGYLITSVLIGDRASKSFYQDFYWKRALRILPLYVLCLLITLAITHNIPSFVFSALFLANFASVFHVATDGPFWTLAIEEQFYLIWPTVVRRRSLHQLLRWAIAVGVAAFLLRLGFAWFGHYNYFLSFLRCDGLAFGAILACRFRLQPQARRRDSIALVTVFLAGACLTVATQWLPSSTTAASLRAVALTAAIYQSGIVLLTGSVIGLTILHTGAAPIAFLRSRVLTFFGLISYALYMVHDGLLVLYDHFFGPILADQNERLLIRMTLVLAVVILLCIVSRYAIELPALSLRKYVLSRPSSTANVDPPLPLARM